MATTNITSARTQPGSAAKAADYRVGIRMYRQGLGDCFLLSFPRETGGHTHVMIDCGVVLGTPNPAVPMKKVAQNLIEETEGNIDVLVITHEHWDHLSGFTTGQALHELEQITFGELWLAWTEDEKNDLANALRRERALKKAAVAAAREKLAKLGKKAKKRAQRLEALMGFNGPETEAEGGGEGVGGTAEALAYLKRKIRNQQILKPGERPLNLPGLDGVRIFVLGPPEQKTRLAKANPGKGQGYGLMEGMSLSEAFASALGVGDTERAQPFAASFRRDLAKLPFGSTYRNPKNSWRNIDDDWLGAGERLALQLDSDTNNTSLVLAFELIATGDVLLFVGDAQAGNWLSWDDYKWKMRDWNGDQHLVTAQELLGRTILYKVGHHGSHNATLREKGLERMRSPALVAMMPVDEDVAHNTKGWVHMPLPKLCERLQEKCAAVIRADKGVFGTCPRNGRIESAPLYIDYLI